MAEDVVETMAGQAKTRLLWVGDAATHSGFARVTHGVLDVIHEDYDLTVLGVGYKGSPHNLPYSILPCGEDHMGVGVLLEIVLTLRPQIVVLFNDLWVVKRYLDLLAKLPESVMPKIVTYSPVDAGGIIPRWVEPLEQVDAVCTYTEFARGEIKRGGYGGEVRIIPHGVDLGDFKSVDKAGARKILGLPQDRWIVLNANTNTFRKRIDLTVKGWVDFIKYVHPFKVDKKRIPVLYLHMAMTSPTGMELGGLVARECAQAGIDPGSWFLFSHPDRMPLSLEALNLLYNAADVGINTSMGEGWGLCPFEMAALGKPQILTNCAASKELFTGKAWMLPVEGTLTFPQICTEGKFTTRHHVARALLEAYTDETLAKEKATAAQEMVLSDPFRWEAVAGLFKEVFDDLL